MNKDEKFYIGSIEFTYNKFSSLEGKTVISYDSDKFCISASKTGIVIAGTIELFGTSMLDDFAKLISEAWTDYSLLKPKLTMSKTEH